MLNQSCSINQSINRCVRIHSASASASASLLFCSINLYAFWIRPNNAMFAGRLLLVIQLVDLLEVRAAVGSQLYSVLFSLVQTFWRIAGLTFISCNYLRQIDTLYL